MRNGVDNTPGRQHKGHISLRLLFLPSLYPSYDRPFAHGPGLTVDGVELVIRGPPLNTGRLIIVLGVILFFYVVWAFDIQAATLALWPLCPLGPSIRHAPTGGVQLRLTTARIPLPKV